MKATTQQLITAADFFQMPNPVDGSRQELEKGVIVTMPPPDALHGACCSKVDRILGGFVEEKNLGTVFSNDTGFISERDPDTVRGPDVSFWSKDRLREIPEGYIDDPPDLAVEVVSPSDHFGRMQAKMRHYLTRGVRMVWLIDPTDRSVTVYRSLDSGKIVLESATLSGEDVLPGFSIPVARLFP
jgi:Uma2 family endonuclease